MPGISLERMFYIIHKERLVDKRVLKEALLVQRFRRGTGDGGRGTGWGMENGGNTFGSNARPRAFCTRHKSSR
ncbi:MAG: hypothetical protein DRI65_16000 [Chloroflexota bacterium]|nr:MAG: hypothetical protein DRI65_16000 [Chloroflexota bacterium]